MIKKEGKKKKFGKNNFNKFNLKKFYGWRIFLYTGQKISMSLLLRFPVFVIALYYGIMLWWHFIAAQYIHAHDISIL